MPKIEESVEAPEKENIKFMDDENEEIKNELIKDTEVSDDRLKKDKIFNNVSSTKESYNGNVLYLLKIPGAYGKLLVFNIPLLI